MHAPHYPPSVDGRLVVASASLFLVPALHPLLLPLVGVPSHLLWWVHVLPVALLTFARGRAAAAGSVASSALLVTVGESIFGQGYGIPASSGTVASLAVAVTATNLLIVTFALYARRVSRRYRMLFDRVRMAVIRVGPNDRVLGANPAALDLLGLADPQPIVSEPIDDVLKAPGLDSLSDLEHRGAWTGELTVECHSGRRSLQAILTS